MSFFIYIDNLMIHFTDRPSTPWPDGNVESIYTHCLWVKGLAKQQHSEVKGNMKKKVNFPVKTTAYKRYLNTPLCLEICTACTRKLKGKKRRKENKKIK